MDNKSEIIFSEDKKRLIKCSETFNAKKYIIPDGVEEISDFAFKGCSELEEIEIPSSVQEIGESAFEETSLKDIIIPSSVYRIDNRAFAHTKIEKAIVPKTVKEIGLSIFAGVKEIEVYDNLDSANVLPAFDYIDDINGRPNGYVGFVGVYQYPKYTLGACNSVWYEHTITVRSAKDDSIKRIVFMPGEQQRNIRCTYVSSWGKNAEFNYRAIDERFEKLTPLAQRMHTLYRLQFKDRLTAEMQHKLIWHLKEYSKQILDIVFQQDDIESLKNIAKYGIINKNNIDIRLEAAKHSNADKCAKWLESWTETAIKPFIEKVVDDNRSIARLKQDIAKKITEGSLITFGCFEQGNGVEPIEWLVLDRKDDKVLLISKKCLATHTLYHVGKEYGVRWDNSNTRIWLNKTFYNKAFNRNEKLMIEKTKCAAEPNDYVEYPRNPGKDTLDRIFLLSISEAKKYFKTDVERRAALTDYARQVGTYSEGTYKTAEGDVACIWWLRSHPEIFENMSVVNDDGSINHNGIPTATFSILEYEATSSKTICLRPAMWIDLQ